MSSVEPTDHCTSEHLLIERIKGWVGGAFIGDDCALLPGGQLITTDSLVEGTHFVLGWTSFRDLGWKAAAVNISDIAACAGRPRYLLISLTVPEGLSPSGFRDFYQELVACCSTYKTRVVGGDLTRGPVFSMAITILGDVHENGSINRSGARPGDAVVVTGDFGASAAGLFLLSSNSNQADQYPYLLNRHRRPLPRLCESWALVRRTAGRAALMDASDGLADALSQIARKSKVGMDISLDQVPVHSQTRVVAALAQREVWDWVLYGGEDYELVACLSEDLWKDWCLTASQNPFSKIGTVTDSQSIKLTLDGQIRPPLDLSKCFEQVNLKE